MLDKATQAQRGGAGKLTPQSEGEAQFNLYMGYTNLVLAGVDTGASTLAFNVAKSVGSKGLQALSNLDRAAMDRILLAAQSKVTGQSPEWILAMRDLKKISGNDQSLYQRLVNAFKNARDKFPPSGGGSQRLATEGAGGNTGRITEDLGKKNQPLKSQGTGGSRAGEGFRQLDENTRKVIEQWPNVLQNKVDSLLAQADNDEVRRLIQSTVLRKSPDEAQTNVKYLVDSLLERQQTLPKKLTPSSASLRKGGQNEVFTVNEDSTLLVKKPLSGKSDFKDEYRALLRMESMGIETALVKRTQIGQETVLVLKRIPGEISKTIMDVREGQNLRHLVKQKTIDDLKKIYKSLVANDTDIRDFQFMVREGDGGVVVVDPKSARIDTPPSKEIENTISTFERYLDENKRLGR
jgi:hypothetical protein